MNKLTARENEVLKLMVKGYSNLKISKELSITESTVKAHVSSILKKLKVSNRIKAVVFAIKENLITIYD